MNISVKGIDDVIKNLKSIATRAKEFERTKQVPLRDLLTTSFLLKFTKFKNFDEISELDEEVIYDDDFIKQNTQFKTHEDMITEASKIYMSNYIVG